MKTNGVSSNCRSKTKMGVSAHDRSGCVPTAASFSGGEARRERLDVAPLPAGGLVSTHVPGKRTKSHASGASTLKDVKNEGRSGNVYENKGPDDNLPDAKDDICARLHAILHRNARNLQKLTALLRLSEPFGTNTIMQKLPHNGAIAPRPAGTGELNDTKKSRGERNAKDHPILVVRRQGRRGGN